MPADMHVYGEHRVGHSSFHFVPTATDHTTKEEGCFASSHTSTVKYMDLTECCTGRGRKGGISPLIQCRFPIPQCICFLPMQVLLLRCSDAKKNHR